MRREGAFWTGQADVAPVALFRIAYGLLALNWFWQLLPNLTAFFTDEGMFPRASQVSFFARNFTLLNVAGDTWQVALIWLASLAAAAALTIGFHTRTAAFVTFVMMASFLMRNPLIGDASDDVFRASAFWLGFTAAGDRYSVDAWIRTRRGDPPSGLAWALPIRILELQFAWIYLATGLEKLAGPLWRDGLAVFYALQLEHTFSRPWSVPLGRNTDLTRIATWLTLVTELAFVPLAFLPYVRRIGRLLAVGAAAGMHLSILVLMNVGNFPLIMLAGLIPFLPPPFVHAVAARLRLPALPARPATGSPDARTSRWRRPGGIALAILALTVFSTSLPAYAAIQRPAVIEQVLQYADLGQRWNMFAPDPLTSDGWLRIPAVLADGSRVDLITGGPPSEEPLFADPLYSRWAKVTEVIAAKANAAYRLEYGRMYCRSRNLRLQPGQAAIVSFEVIYYERPVPPPGGAQQPVLVHLLHSHRC